MSRLDAIRPAARPKMHGRALLSGPPGAGKTWTSLGMGTKLAEAEGRPGSILLIDTERESALTYADSFTFEHLPWRPPYDPDELATTLRELTADRYAVVIIDSLSHFWRGMGGTLDIADGRIGGWKVARPVQERLVDALLTVPAHLLLCVRSKMDYLVEGGKSNQTVTKVGLAPIQDDTLPYEVNIAVDIDAEHRITVTKSRTPAVPVGRMYPAGQEAKAAEDYAAWLAGGVPPASRAEVEAIVGTFATIAGDDDRKRLKALFVELFGMPHTLTADTVVEADAWLTEQVAALEAAPTGGGAAPTGITDTATGAPDELDVAVDEFEVGDSDPDAGPIDGERATGDETVAEAETLDRAARARADVAAQVAATTGGEAGAVATLERPAAVCPNAPHPNGATYCEVCEPF